VDAATKHFGCASTAGHEDLAGHDREKRERITIGHTRDVLKEHASSPQDDRQR